MDSRAKQNTEYINMGYLNTLNASGQINNLGLTVKKPTIGDLRGGDDTTSRTSGGAFMIQQNFSKDSINRGALSHIQRAGQSMLTMKHSYQHSQL